MPSTPTEYPQLSPPSTISTANATRQSRSSRPPRNTTQRNNSSRNTETKSPLQAAIAAKTPPNAANNNLKPPNRAPACLHPQPPTSPEAPQTSHQAAHPHSPACHPQARWAEDQAHPPLQRSSHQTPTPTPLPLPLQTCRPPNPCTTNTNGTTASWMSCSATTRPKRGTASSSYVQTAASSTAWHLPAHRASRMSVAGAVGSVGRGTVSKTNKRRW